MSCSFHGSYASQVTDAGLAHFKACKELTLLTLDNTQVTDGALAHFKDWPSLRELRVASHVFPNPPSFLYATVGLRLARVPARSVAPEKEK